MCKPMYSNHSRSCSLPILHIAEVPPIFHFIRYIYTCSIHALYSELDNCWGIYYVQCWLLHTSQWVYTEDIILKLRLRHFGQPTLNPSASFWASCAEVCPPLMETSTCPVMPIQNTLGYMNTATRGGSRSKVSHVTTEHQGLSQVKGHTYFSDIQVQQGTHQEVYCLYINYACGQCRLS